MDDDTSVSTTPQQHRHRGFRDYCTKRYHSVHDAVMPPEPNVNGIECGSRALVGAVFGAFGILGVIAAENPVLGVALGMLLLVFAAYMLATAKSQTVR